MDAVIEVEVAGSYQLQGLPSVEMKIYPAPPTHFLRKISRPPATTDAVGGAARREGPAQ
jgi:hypothetical protein